MCKRKVTDGLYLSCALQTLGECETRFVYIQNLLTGVVANVVELVGVGSKVHLAINGCCAVFMAACRDAVVGCSSPLLILVIGDRT